MRLDKPSHSRGAIPPRVFQNDVPQIQRAQEVPGAQRTRSLACNWWKNTHASRDRYAETVRHSLRNGLRLIARSPRCPALIATVVVRGVSGRKADIANSRDLIPASGDQDHTPLPSEAASLVNDAAFVHRIPQHVS